MWASYLLTDLPAHQPPSLTGKSLIVQRSGCCECPRKGRFIAAGWMSVARAQLKLPKIIGLVFLLEKVRSPCQQLESPSWWSRQAQFMLSKALY